MTDDATRLAALDTKIAELSARTWADSDPEITASTRLAAEALNMGAGEVWKTMEVWIQCAAKEALLKRMSRKKEGN